MASTPRALRRMLGGRRRTLAGVAGLAIIAAGATAYGVTHVLIPGPQGDGTSITPTGWKVSPVGKQVEVGERPYGLALSPDGTTLLVSNNGVDTQSVMSVDAASGQVKSTITYKAPEAVFMGLAFSADGTAAYASGGPTNKIRTYRVSNGTLTEGASLMLDTLDANGEKTNPFPAGVAVSKDGKTVYAADNLMNALSVVDTATGDETRIPLSDADCVIGDWGDTSQGKACLYPNSVVVSKDGATAWVSDWGTDSISVVDLKAGKATGTIRVGNHPSAMALNPAGDRLYVSNTDADTVAVVDTAAGALDGTIPLHPYRGAPVGTSPNALQVSADGKRLYVAGAGNNDVTVIRLTKKGGTRQGYIPTGWYPTGIALDPAGKRVYVANAKGLGAGPNPQGPNPNKDPGSTPDQYLGSMIKGTLSIVDSPDGAKLREYTDMVRSNGDFAKRDSVRGDGAGQKVIPTTVGGTSPIKHVIYVVNENRTYDQVLGDLGKGNGAPSLTIFPRSVTPNHHRLAEQYVTLDNIFAAGEVSNDGWEWSTGANANMLDQQTWPTNYGGRGYFYTGEGGSPAAAPGYSASSSYIWQALDQKGISYRNYGFWATDVPPVKVYNAPTLDAHTNHDYAGFNMAIPDQSRFAVWLKDFKQAEASGSLPTMTFLKFPRDHTDGTTPGAETPSAMVADSDYALGRLVDTVSHSRFWKDTAIFVIEDDAQDGPDHVDAHRVLAHVVSPYTRTGKVDSTFYSSVSMLRTMELIVGVSPLTQFDAAATPMFASFTDTPDATPYTAAKPDQPLEQKNPENAPMAAASASWNFRVEDQAPRDQLNKAIWESVKGASSRMPAPVNGLGLATESDDR
ncbi:MAG: bifunctional YncE family protein/alkaline phosphatase family protein [Thermoleophilia bacterium]